MLVTAENLMNVLNRRTEQAQLVLIPAKRENIEPFLPTRYATVRESTIDLDYSGPIPGADTPFYSIHTGREMKESVSRAQAASVSHLVRTLNAIIQKHNGAKKMIRVVSPDGSTYLPVRLVREGHLETIILDTEMTNPRGATDQELKTIIMMTLVSEIAPQESA